MRPTQQVPRTFIAALCIFAALGSVSLLSGKTSFSDAPGVSQPQPTQWQPLLSSANPEKVQFGPRLRVETGSLPNFEWKAATSAATAAFFVRSVTAVKSATLSVDVNGKGFVNPGDALLYTVMITNAVGAMTATNINFNNTLEANTTFVVGTLVASPIAVSDAT